MSIHVENRDGQHRFETQVYLDSLDPDSLRVELFANGLGDDDPPVIHVMKSHATVVR